MLRSFLTAFFFAGLAVIVCIVLGVFGAGLVTIQKINTFAQRAQTTPNALIETFKAGWNTPPQQSNNHVNFFILGTDEVETRGHAVELTDTMLIASLDLKTGNISLYSIPRDLWLPNYQTKINALYEYGKERYPNEPEKFPQEVVEKLTGVPIHHVFVLKLTTLTSLIDTVGGVDIDVKEGFVDDQFPCEGVDVTKERDPAKLYCRVEFTPGVEHMSGRRVSEYVRSRHAVGDQGNDTARGSRQQEVILALVNRLKSPRFYVNTARAGELYSFYQAHFARALPITQAIGIGKELFENKAHITFSMGGPSIYPDNPDGTIFHPPVSTKYQKQWVFELRSAEKFAQEAKQILHIP